MANGLPPPAEIPSTEALRRAALARSARRGARVAAWRLGLRWLLWGLGQALMALGALTVATLVFLALRWGWQELQTRWTTAEPARPAAASAPAPQAASTSAPAAPASAPEPSPDRPANRYPLRLDDSETVPAAAAGAQSPSPHNARPSNP